MEQKIFLVKNLPTKVGNFLFRFYGGIAHRFYNGDIFRFIEMHTGNFASVFLGDKLFYFTKRKMERIFFFAKVLIKIIYFTVYKFINKLLMDRLAISRIVNIFTAKFQ